MSDSWLQHFLSPRLLILQNKFLPYVISYVHKSVKTNSLSVRELLIWFCAILSDVRLPLLQLTAGVSKAQVP